MTREETRQLLKFLYAAYPNMKKISASEAKIMLDAWQMTFADYEAEQIYKAARLHIKQSKYFPNSADLVSKVYKASLIYDIAEPTIPQIEAPETCYIVDMTYYDNLLELEPSEHCLNCSEYGKCYKTV